MTEKGYRYGSPRDAGADLDTSLPTVSAQEIAVATADVACKQRTHVVEVWSAFEIAYQEQQIKQHTKELKQIKASVSDLLAKAEQIIAAAGA